MPAQRPAKRSNRRVILSKIMIVVFALAAIVGGSEALNHRSESLVQFTTYALVELPDTSALARQPAVVIRQVQPSR